MKKGSTPLPTYLVHLYAQAELLSAPEQEVYDNVLTLQKYGGPEPDSDE